MDVTVPQAATWLPVRSLAVEVTEGADAGARAAGDAITIGSAEGADLRLTDPMVSRYHVAPGTVVRVGATSVRVGDAAPLEVEILAADALAGLVGRSPAMRRLMAQI